LERLLHDLVLERRISLGLNTPLAKGRIAGPLRYWAGSLRPCHPGEHIRKPQEPL
jgi:hypothetical protein